MKAESISKHTTPLKLLAVSALFLFQALGAATITGRVTDAGSGDYLPGANIVLEGTNLGAASDRAGEYRIANVPPGAVTLVVTYVGYEEYSEPITVSDGDNTFDIALSVSYVEMDEVVVSGLRQGDAKALSQQKASDHIENIVSAEQIERFPDPNAAEALRRLPGVSVQKDHGEGRYVLIRGTAARLNTTMINGERIW
jgi:hypothetical protein